MTEYKASKGVIVALVTPLDEQGNLLEDAARKLVRYVIKGGVHGLFPVGTAGEFYAIETRTKIRMTEIALEEAGGKLPVYMGTAAMTTRECVELSRAAESMGATGVTVLTPLFPKCGDAELYAHYAAIASATRLPVMLYTNPGTGATLTPAVVGRLAQIENIVGIKDSSGDLSLLAEYIEKTAGADFSVLVGRDSLILGALAYGAIGAVAATANAAPALAASIYDHYMAGRFEQAREAQYRLLPLRRAFGLGSTSAAMLKEAARMLGIDCGAPVPPVLPLGEKQREELREILGKMGVL